MGIRHYALTAGLFDAAPKVGESLSVQRLDCTLMCYSVLEQCPCE